MVFHLKKHNLTATVTHGNRFGTILQLALVSEVRMLQLAEFTNFLLSMIEERRKVATAYMAGLVGGTVSKEEWARERGRLFARIEVEPMGLRLQIGATLHTFKCPVGWSRGFENSQSKRRQGEYF